MNKITITLPELPIKMMKVIKGKSREFKVPEEKIKEIETGIVGIETFIEYVLPAYRRSSYLYKVDRRAHRDLWNELYNAIVSSLKTLDFHIRVLIPDKELKRLRETPMALEMLQDVMPHVRRLFKETRPYLMAGMIITDGLREVFDDFTVTLKVSNRNTKRRLGTTYFRAKDKADVILYAKRIGNNPIRMTETFLHELCHVIAPPYYRGRKTIVHGAPFKHALEHLVENTQIDVEDMRRVYVNTTTSPYPLNKIRYYVSIYKEW